MSPRSFVQEVPPTEEMHGEAASMYRDVRGPLFPQKDFMSLIEAMGENKACLGALRTWRIARGAPQFFEFSGKWGGINI